MEDQKVIAFDAQIGRVEAKTFVPRSHPACTVSSQACFVHVLAQHPPNAQEQRQDEATLLATQRANQAAFQANAASANPDIPVLGTAVPTAPNPAPVSSQEGSSGASVSGNQNAEERLDIPTIRVESAETPSHAVAVKRDPDTKVTKTAYHEAWSKLDEDERAKLSSETSIKTLFEELDETDREHQSNSWFKRGKMAAGLQYVSKVCGYVDLVSTWIPVPELGAALGLVKGTVAVAVSICGIYDGLTSHVREFLDHIPVIERCNTVLWSNSASFDIHNILVACYSTLLAFYSKVMAFLLQESRIRRLLETFHSEIPRLVGDFNGHAEKLSKTMEVETLVTVRKILDQQIDIFVNDNLYRQEHAGNRNAEEGNRSDDACRWIVSNPTFEDWAYGAHGVLTMYGVTGCGKTATASYVAKYLREEGQSPVLAYYCTQREDNQLRHVLCSLTYQLLQAKPELKEKFKDWSEKRQLASLDKPSNIPTILAEFLCSSLESSREHVFVILDGLDDCEEDARIELLTLLRNLIRGDALVKVFVSSQPRDDILQTLTGSLETEEGSDTESIAQIPLFHVDMNPTAERDRTLAKHLAARPLRDIADNKVREKAIEELAKRAGGSAMWLKLATASLTGAKNEHRIQKCLKFLETEPKLIDWYERLFKDAESATCNDRDILERALETLTVARRPMTIDELARAAHIDDLEDDDTLTVLNEAAEGIDFMSLVRPFVATLGTSGDGKHPSVRLVHQSLVELLLAARPSQWDSMATKKVRKEVTTKEKEERKHWLEEQLAERCVKYLLFDDLDDARSSENSVAVPDDDPGAAEDQGGPWGSLFEEPAIQKRMEVRTQTSHLHFYEYAAVHWASHFAACEKHASEHLREHARALLNVDVEGRHDWASFVRAEREAGGEIFPASSESATLAAYFGLYETLSEFLSESDSLAQRTMDEALFWAAWGGREPMVKLLLKSRADMNQHFVDLNTALTVAAQRGHLDCVQALLADGRTDVNLQGSTSRTALSFAASSGHEKICAILLKQDGCALNRPDWKGKTPLFYAVNAEHLPTIKVLAAAPGVNVNHMAYDGRTALCQAAESGLLTSLKHLLDTKGVDVNLPDKDGKTPLIWAAYRGHAACVEALLQHPQIDKTAVDSKENKNAVHFACELGMHEALRSLLKHDCPGVDDQDVNGWTPLMWAVQYGPECVLSLIATGRVEINRRDHRGNTALSHAVQWGSRPDEICRVLIDHGAHPQAKDGDTSATPA